MNIQLVNKEISDIDSEVLIEFLTNSELKDHKDAKILNSAGFKAEQDSTCFLYEKAIVILPSFFPNGFFSVLTKCAKDGRYERYSLSGNRFGTIGRGFDEV